MSLESMSVPAADVRSGYLFVKRVIDVIGALVLLLLLSPVFLIIVICIKLDSKGTIIFRQKRLGLGGRAFVFYKFRSMCVDAEKSKTKILHLNEVSGPIFKIRNDPRITRVGKFMRRYSLDELPQLFNVLKGDMSFVGPRPPLPDEVEQYEEWQLRRLSVIPGITCLWQISGRSKLSFDEWVKLDLQYIDSRSIWLDIIILLKTIPAVISADGAY
ncbi:MAG: exopolysaccharide biosynthesis polyprenyl glycosylphosphotransferase [Armatimonadota bacterium]